MPNLPWTKSKEKNPVPEASTSDPVRSASPSMLERLFQKKKRKGQAYSTAHRLPGAESSTLLVPSTSRSTISADRRLSDASIPSYRPLSTSPSSSEVSSPRGNTPSPSISTSQATLVPQQCLSQVVTEHEKGHDHLISPCDSASLDWPPSGSPSVSTSVHKDKAYPTPPRVFVPALDQDSPNLPYGSTSTSAQTSWRSNIAKYSNAMLKVLGVLTGSPVGSLIEETEVGAFALV